MTTVCPEWQWGSVGEVRRWGRTLCLDCLMQKCISNWFRHVQVAPAVMNVEMVYLKGCSCILELITPAQGRFNSQHFTRPLCCWSLWHLSAVSRWEPLLALLPLVALLRPQTCMWNPSLLVSDTPPGLIPSSLEKDPPPLSLYCVPDIHFLKRPHL